MVSEFDPCPKCKKKEGRSRKEELILKEDDGSSSQNFIMYCKDCDFHYLEKYQNL